MGGFKGNGLVLRGMLIRPHMGWRLLRSAVSEFCSRTGNLFIFGMKRQSAPRCGMEGFKGKGSGSLWNAHQASQRLATSAPSG